VCADPKSCSEFRNALPKADANMMYRELEFYPDARRGGGKTVWRGAHDGWKRLVSLFGRPVRPSDKVEDGQLPE
jgi:hypothetical protein